MFFLILFVEFGVIFLMSCVFTLGTYLAILLSKNHVWNSDDTQFKLGIGLLLAWVVGIFLAALISFIPTIIEFNECLTNWPHCSLPQIENKKDYIFPPNVFGLFVVLGLIASLQIYLFPGFRKTFIDRYVDIREKIGTGILIAEINILSLCITWPVVVQLFKVM